MISGTMASGRTDDAEDFLDTEEIRRRIASETVLLGKDEPEINALYLRSLQRAGAFVARHPDLGVFVMFIGYSRSGHSLIGALLDAHPEMVIAHELDLIRFVEKGFSREQVFYLLDENARLFARVGRAWGRYGYAVPGQWQGRCTRLRVIGDKRGGRSSQAFATNPYYLARIARFVGLPMRFIHVVRNPFDQVASMILRRKAGAPPEEVPRIVSRASAINQLIGQRMGERGCLTLRHEAFLADPAASLARICAFVGLDAPPGYLEACAAIVNPEASKTRTRIAWTPALHAATVALIDEFPALSAYRDDLMPPPA